MQPSQLPSRPLNRSWRWYFLFLAVAGLCAVIIPLVYNLRQQLRPEQLEAARQRWQEKGPRAYDLIYETKQNGDPRPDEYRVLVRDGQVCLVFINREVLLADETALPLGGALGPASVAVAAERPPQRSLTGYTVEGLFQEIAEKLKSNAESNGSNFATASFDVTDGHPLRYIYRVRHSSERVEWNVKLVRQ